MTDSQSAPLETERLLLRHVTFADLDEIYQLVYVDPLVKATWSGRTGTPDEIKAGFAKEHIEASDLFGLRPNQVVGVIENMSTEDIHKQWS